MNIKDSYIHNGTAVLKDVKVENSVLKKILAGKDANDAYLGWETVCDLTGIKPKAAGTADKVGHKLTFSGGVTGTWDGSADKTVAIPTKSSWNYDDVYLKLTGNGTTNPLTGTIYIKDVNGIILNSKDKDLNIWEVYGNSGAWTSQYGFNLQYLGTGSGNNNDLILWAHNQAGTHVESYRVKQDGTFIFKAVPKVGTNVMYHAGNLTASVIGGLGTLSNNISGNAATATKLYSTIVHPFNSSVFAYRKFASINVKQYEGKTALLLLKSYSTPNTLYGNSCKVYINVYQQTSLGTSPRYNIETDCDDRFFSIYAVVNYTSTLSTVDLYVYGKEMAWYSIDVTLLSGDNIIDIGDVINNLPDGVVITPTKYGSVYSASKWATARTITLTGSVTGSVSINGSQNVSLDTITNHTHTFASLTEKPTTISGYGITDALKIDGSNGTAAGVSALINKLDVGSSTPTDTDYYICQYAGGETTNTTYYRRPMSAMWNWIKTKTDTLYPTKTGSGASGTWGISITGNAKTATTSTYASNVGSSGTAGTNYVTAANVISMYNWYNSITATDEASNTAIDKWNEIVSFLAGIADTSTLSGILAGYAAVGHNHDKTYLKLSGGNVTGQTTIRKDLTGNLSDWVSKQHLGPFEVGRATNSMCVAIGVTDDNYGYIQVKGANITTPGNLVLLPGGGNLTVGNATNTVYHKGNLSIATLMGSTAIGDSDEPVYWNGNKFVKAGVYPTKSSWNYDDRYLKLSGGKITGPVTFEMSHDRKIYINNSDNETYWSLISFQQKGTEYGTLGTAGSTDLQWNGHNLYHAGNLTASVIGSLGTLSNNISGNAATATKATQDGNGNVIANTYLHLSGGTLTGTLGKSNNYIFKPNGGDFRTRTEIYNGAICISLPANIGNTMLSMWIDVYNYSINKSFSVHVGGYTYNNSTFSNSPFAMVYGASHKVRLTYDNGFKIYIGETNSTWNYPQISIRDVILGFGHNYSNWYNDWSVSFVTSFSTINTEITRYAITTDNISNQSVNYANSAGSVAWNNVTGKPTSFTPATHTHTFASLTEKPTTISGYGITDGLRRVTLANNVENDFNTFENLTLTGRGDPTTGSSLLNSPWTTQPAGGFGALTYLWSSYGLQLAAGYSSNDLYIRNKYYLNGDAVWDTKWDKILNSSNYNSYSPKLDGTGATGTWKINITGSAGSVARATFGDSSNGTHDANAMTSNGLYYYRSNGPTINAHNFATDDAAMYVQAYNSSWVSQIAQDYRSGKLAVRSRNNGTWQPWRRIAFADSDYIVSADKIHYEPEHRKFTRTASGNSWDTQAYSVCGYKECRVIYKISQTNAYIMVGLNSDPTTDASYQSIDYCWYTQSGGSLSMYENGTSIGSISGHTTYAVGDELIVEYSCGQVRYYHNGVLCRAVARTYGSPLYFDSSFYNVGSIENVVFEPIHDSLDFVQTTATYSLSNAAWTNTITLPTTTGSYILNIVSGNSTLTGVFSIGASDNAKDEISLHLHGNGPRLYARTNGTTLQLSSNDASATSRSVTIKYRRMI